MRKKQKNNRESFKIKLSPPPKATNENVSKAMRGNKKKGTKPELLLRKALCKIGLNRYKLNWKYVPGSPDICYPSKKVAIFVNGCYWHRCPKCKLTLPKSNTEWWKIKFERNQERDKLKIKKLKKLKWTVIIIWECEIKNNIDKVINKIQRKFI